ncbi:MAG: hypothetical protein HC837_07850 [Chloroflexaceae bacterium]|nr:hypothetical protein [Chloroflexaceae bacterium]
MQSSQDLIHTVQQRLDQGETPSVAETRALLEQLRAAQLEIELLQVAIREAQASLNTMMKATLRATLDRF